MQNQWLPTDWGVKITVMVCINHSRFMPECPTIEVVPIGYNRLPRKGVPNDNSPAAGPPAAASPAACQEHMPASSQGRDDRLVDVYPRQTP